MPQASPVSAFHLTIGTLQLQCASELYVGAPHTCAANSLPTALPLLLTVLSPAPEKVPEEQEAGESGL